MPYEIQYCQAMANWNFKKTFCQNKECSLTLVGVIKWPLPSHLVWECLFDLILYVPSTIFQLYRDKSSWVEPVLS